jgi:hypothetical protein
MIDIVFEVLFYFVLLSFALGLSLLCAIGWAAIDDTIRKLRAKQ